MINYLLLGLVLSIGWHFGKLLYQLVEEVLFSRLHAEDWYAVLCKKMDPPEKMPKIIPAKLEKPEIEPYKGTTMGFRGPNIQ